MSRKYIGQINKNNFVYPNNTLAEYDVDIVHDINNNSVSGTTSGFSALYNSGTGNIGISFTYIWNKNGADPFIDESDLLHVLSVHMSEPSKEYYKPWRMVSGVTTATITATTKTDTFTFIVTPSMMGVNSFTSGVYNFEIRFIGKRAIYPLCYTTSIMIVTPTPTPPVPCYCYPIVVTGSTLPPPEGGFIATLDYNNCDGERVGRLFQVGPGTYYQCIQTVDGVVQYFEGTNGIDTSYLTIPGVGNCNTGYDCTGYVPAGSTPTPTPTVTVSATNGYVPPTPTPTVTVSATNGYVPPTSTPTPTPTVTKTSGYVAPTPTPTPTTSGSESVRIDWFLGMAAGARLTVTNNVSATLLDETSTGGSSRSGTIYVPVSELPYTVTGWWNSGSSNIVRYNICDLGSGGEYYSSGAIDNIVDSESVLVLPTPLYVGINVVGQDTTPPTCPS